MASLHKDFDIARERCRKKAWFQGNLSPEKYEAVHKKINNLENGNKRQNVVKLERSVPLNKVPR